MPKPTSEWLEFLRRPKKPESKRKDSYGTDFEMYCRNARRLLGYAMQHTAPGQEAAHLDLADYEIKLARKLLRGHK